MVSPRDSALEIVGSFIYYYYIYTPGKLESDVCCRLQEAPSGESYEGKRSPGRK